MNTNYIIYAHISPSGKCYIGQTKVGVDQRWGNNGYNYTTKRSNGNYRHPAFAKAILKYGWDKFEHKILFSGLSKIEADAKTGKSLPSKRKIAVVQETLDGSFVNRFDSITEAAEATGVNHIWDVLKGKYRTAGGFVWKYEEY